MTEGVGLGELALDIEELSVSFRDTPVLDRVNLRLEAGQFLGIIGPNGGGKSTLLKLILGLLKPERGKILVFGAEPRVGQRRVAYVPQHLHFDPGFPIQVLDVVLMGRLGPDTLLRRLSRHDQERGLEALRAVQMEGLADRQIGKLSGGQLQRVLIARGLAADARLLLLDEPTASLDPRIGAQIYELLQGLRPALTIVLVSHDLRGVATHASRLACVNRSLYYHASAQITREILEETYGYSFDAPVSRGSS